MIQVDLFHPIICDSDYVISSHWAGYMDAKVDHFGGLELLLIKSTQIGTNFLNFTLQIGVLN